MHFKVELSWRITFQLYCNLMNVYNDNHLPISSSSTSLVPFVDLPTPPHITYLYYCYQLESDSPSIRSPSSQLQVWGAAFCSPGPRNHQIKDNCKVQNCTAQRAVWLFVQSLWLCCVGIARSLCVLWRIAVWAVRSAIYLTPTCFWIRSELYVDRCTYLNAIAEMPRIQLASRRWASGWMQREP